MKSESKIIREFHPNKETVQPWTSPSTAQALPVFSLAKQKDSLNDLYLQIQ